MRTKTLNELLSAKPPKTLFVIEPRVLPVGGVMALYGPAGALKSWLSIELARAVSTGTRWLDTFETNKLPVLVVQSEQTEAQYVNRLYKFFKFESSNPDNLFFDNDLGIRLDQYHGAAGLGQDMAERKPGLVILDCLYQMISGSVSSEPDLKRMKDTVDGLRDKWNCSFVIVHHPRKSSRDEGAEEFGPEEMLGHSVFRNWLDTIVKVSPVPKGASQPSLVDLEFQKVRSADVDIPAVRYKFDRRTVRFSIA